MRKSSVRYTIASKKSSVYSLLTFVLCSFYATLSFAQPESSCDPRVWDALSSRGWIEAQREITQNQNFILKPDSVLEYACTDQLIGRVSMNYNSKRPFSETNYWGTSLPNYRNVRTGLYGRYPGGDPGANPRIPPIVDDLTTDYAIWSIVDLELEKYLEINFQKPYLSERSSLNSVVNGGLFTGFERYQDPYECNEIKKVWEEARCLNFQDKARDIFFDFRYYINHDPRALPSGSACFASPDMEDTIQEAFANNEAIFTMNPSIDVQFRDGTPFTENTIQTYLGKILPDGVGPAGSTALQGKCEHKIPTGIVVERNDLRQDLINSTGVPFYFEMACTNPGCRYDPFNRRCVDTDN